MSDYIQIITDLKDKVQSNKEELIRLEENQKNLKIEKEKIISSLKELEINENDLDNKIETMEEELNKEIDTIKESLK